MLAEEQVRALLLDCEDKVGHPLSDLRTRLMRSKDTLGAIWELVVLHAAGLVGTALPALTEARPDVLLDPPGHTPSFWIEATHVRWPTSERDRAAKFTRWLQRELSRRGIDPSTVILELSGEAPHYETLIPPEQQWAKLRRNDKWKGFLAVLSQSSQAPRVDLPPPFRCSIRTTRRQPDTTLMSSGPAYTPLRAVSDHPVYKALASKGRQTEKWHLAHKPLVVCVGSSLFPSLFEASSGSPRSEEAVHSALVEGTNAVRGRRHISAVMLVSIDDKKGLSWLRRDHNREANVRVITNPAAAVPLTAQQSELVRRLAFNHVPYGPQWETWPYLPAHLRVIGDRDDAGKSFSLSPQRNNGFEFSLPCQDLTRLLTGGTDSSDIKANIGEFLDVLQRRSEHPRLVGAEVIKGDPKIRRPDRICLRFAPPDPPILQVPRTTERPE